MRRITPEIHKKIRRAMERAESVEIHEDRVFEITEGGFIRRTEGFLVNNDIMCVGPYAPQVLQSHPLEDGKIAFYAYDFNDF